MIRNKLPHVILAAALAVPALFATSPSADASKDLPELANKVRHELVMLPFYGVFDNLAFRIDDGVVTLLGHTSRPSLKSGAGNVVARIEGVRAVRNEIEVLPLSRFDDEIRLRVARAVYSQPALQRYALGAVPSIHIIVKNGEVTLEGVVNNEAEKNIANIQANGVFGVFKMNNNLRVENAKNKKA